MRAILPTPSLTSGLIVRDEDLLIDLVAWWPLPLSVLVEDITESVAVRKGETAQDASASFSPLLFACPELY